MDNPTNTCSCWRCWFQTNFVVLLLFSMVGGSFAVTIWIMHENKIPDEYAKWAQGWTEGLLTGLTLAMKAPSGPPTHGNGAPPPPPPPVVS